jgi:hypothetical protein
LWLGRPRCIRIQEVPLFAACRLHLRRHRKTSPLPRDACQRGHSTENHCRFEAGPLQQPSLEKGGLDRDCDPGRDHSAMRECDPHPPSLERATAGEPDTRTRPPKRMARRRIDLPFSRGGSKGAERILPQR